MPVISPLRRAIFESQRPQRHIAAEAGISESHFSRIVNGLRCDDATQHRIASALNREVDELWPADVAA